MKRWTAAVAAAGMLFANGAWAQEAEEAAATTENVEMEAESSLSSKQNVIYVGPLSLIMGGIAWEYERVLSQNMSVAVGVPLQLPFGLAGALSSATGVSIFGVGGMAAMRFYFTGAAPSGLFAGPELNVNYLSISSSAGDASASVSGVGFGVTGLVGYSLVTDSGFSLSGGLGISGGVSGATATATGGGQSGSVSGGGFGIGPTMRLHVGYAF